MKNNGPKAIAIVGAGFSGTVTAINLLRLANEAGTPVRVLLIGAVDTYGKGLAYTTEDDNLLLNVPIGNMSAFPDKPGDLLEFCNGIDAALLSGSFVSRRIYGEYLEARLNEARSENADSLVEIRNFVTRLDRHDEAFSLTLQSGETVAADFIILAFGHFTPRSLAEVLGTHAFDPLIGKDICLDNPWDIPALDRLPVNRDVVIVGTGHTAMDTLFRLVSCPSTRKIYLVSRHGNTPNGHRKSGEFIKMRLLFREVRCEVKRVLAQSPNIRAVFSALRKLARRHLACQGDWRDVINSLRQITPEIWQALPAAERARFMRHVVPHWDVLRHRISPVAISRLDKLIVAGRVEVIAGRITQVRPAPGDKGIGASVRLRGTNRQRDLTAGAIVNCSGPNYDIRRIDHPLVRQLADAGLLRQDAARIGFEVDEHYRCSISPDLYYVGPMLKAKYWEAIAVPELRGHAANLAKVVMARLNQTTEAFANHSNVE